MSSLIGTDLPNTGPVLAADPRRGCVGGPDGTLVAGPLAAGLAADDAE